MTEENIKQPDLETQQIDKDIEADIKHLKRSSNLLATLGLIIVVLFVILLAIKASQNWSPTEQALPRFTESATVFADSSELLDDPLPTAKVLAKLTKGTHLLVMNDNRKDWLKVHAIDSDLKATNGLEGYIKRDDVRTRTQEKQLRRDLALHDVKAIDIVDVDWTINEVGNYTISGKVVNLTDLPLANVKIIITFYDQDNNVVEQRNMLIAADNPIMKNNPTPFAFMGRNEKDFNFVNCRADYRFLDE